MIPDSVGPLSRPFSVAQLPARGTYVTVEASPAEREALAKDLALPGLRALTARLHVTGSPARVHVKGRLTASITQTCVVTLDAFDSEIDEEVEVSFRAPLEGEKEIEPGAEIEVDPDAPDELVGDRIDLGSITAEFLALGLDPYPRKPGVAFEADASVENAPTSPFAALAGLRREEP